MPERRFGLEESVNVPDALESKLLSCSGLAFSSGTSSQSSPPNMIVGSWVNSGELARYQGELEQSPLPRRRRRRRLRVHFSYAYYQVSRI
jgi:hypothetical protein